MKTIDKEAKGFKIFTYVCLLITGAYFFAHLLFLISEAELITPYGELEHSFFMGLLLVDMVSWFIYVPFAGIIIVVQSLYLIARLADTENTKKWFYLPSFLNIVFGSFSIYGIFELFESAV